VLLVDATAGVSGAHAETAFKEKTGGEKPAGIKTKSRAVLDAIRDDKKGYRFIEPAEDGSEDLTLGASLKSVQGRLGEHLDKFTAAMDEFTGDSVEIDQLEEVGTFFYHL